LVVIDGGSTDGTLEIANKYRDNISHFMSEPDKGIYDAMNKGIDYVTGDFILFLNANDVFYDNEVLQKVADALYKNPEAEFLFGEADYISEDGKYSQIVTYEKIKNDFSIIQNNICHQSIFYHKSLFEKFGRYSDAFKIYADWDFNIKCLVTNKVAAIYLPTVICKFQLGGACSTSSIRSVCRREKKFLIKKHYPQFLLILSLSDFLRKNFGTPYKCLINSFLAKKTIKLFTYQSNYKLNLLHPEDGQL
jgi:glycosyltransferase involved in cell wall biosynthesis